MKKLPSLKDAMELFESVYQLILRKEESGELEPKATWGVSINNKDNEREIFMSFAIDANVWEAGDRPYKKKLIYKNLDEENPQPEQSVSAQG